MELYVVAITYLLFCLGANAKIRYQITSGNTKGAFDVEPEVGTIFIAEHLDYEQEQRYELQLVASDGKWENHTLIVINVINNNDEAPVFRQNEYHGNVKEELSDLPIMVLKVNQFACRKSFSYLLKSAKLELPTARAQTTSAAFFRNAFISVNSEVAP